MIYKVITFMTPIVVQILKTNPPNFRGEETMLNRVLNKLGFWILHILFRKLKRRTKLFFLLLSCSLLVIY